MTDQGNQNKEMNARTLRDFLHRKAANRKTPDAQNAEQATTVRSQATQVLRPEPESGGNLEKDLLRIPGTGKVFFKDCPKYSNEVAETMKTFKMLKELLRLHCETPISAEQESLLQYLGFDPADLLMVLTAFSGLMNVAYDEPEETLQKVVLAKKTVTLPNGTEEERPVSVGLILYTKLFKLEDDAHKQVVINKIMSFMGHIQTLDIPWLTRHPFKENIVRLLQHINEHGGTAEDHRKWAQELGIPRANEELGYRSAGMAGIMTSFSDAINRTEDPRTWEGMYQAARYLPQLSKLPVGSGKQPISTQPETANRWYRTVKKAAVSPAPAPPATPAQKKRKPFRPL
jgi:hypothetical protein